jgi:peptidylprolyl isomerase
MIRLISFFAALLMVAAPAFAEDAAAPAAATETKAAEQTAVDLENTLYLELKDGRVVIQLRPDLAPKHAARIKELVRKGFYDGTVFHRVIEGFMAQGGDPTGTGTGGSGQNIPAEFSAEAFTRGTVGMARAADPNSADSQFFITFVNTPHLNSQYTVVGKVTSGMEFVDKITRGEPPANPDKLVSLKVAADVDKAATPPAEEPKVPADSTIPVPGEATKTEEKPATEAPAEKPAETPAAETKDAVPGSYE